VCPRSPSERRKLDAALTVAPKGRWPGKYVQFKFEVARPTRLRPNRTEIFEAFNPGVPMVKPGKPWNAGGLPHGPINDRLSPVGGDRYELALQFKRDFIDRIRVSA
jgi:hypothetical protein